MANMQLVKPFAASLHLLQGACRDMGLPWQSARVVTPALVPRPRPGQKVLSFGSCRAQPEGAEPSLVELCTLGQGQGQSQGQGTARGLLARQVLQASSGCSSTPVSIKCSD